MINFSFDKNPLFIFKKHIIKLEKSIPEIKINHSEGYHGSDKGCCSYCGVVNPNNYAQCDKETQESQERARNQIIQLKKLYKIIGKRTKSQQKLIFKYLNIPS